MSKTLIITYTRKGTCNYLKCKGACCAALNLRNGDMENDLSPGDRITFTNYRCMYLENTGACRIYRNRPSVCLAFPESPWDTIYQRVKGKCSYWFEIEMKEVDDDLSPTDSPSPTLSPEPSDKLTGRP